MSSNRPWAEPRGLLFIVAAPSGAGKTTLCRRMTERFSALRHSVSYTTRPARPGEVSGVHYVFVDEPRFRDLVARGEFLEWAQVHGHLYGTHRGQVEAVLAQGGDVILDVDMQGVASIRALGVGGVFCMILPPSLEALRARLVGRGQDAQEVIERRLDKAREELSHLDLFDYTIVNDDLEQATETLAAVILAEHARRDRLRQDWFQTTFLS